jgi:alkylation response protein AidB-like acyl-CoA dehydrogenase
MTPPVQAVRRAAAGDDPLARAQRLSPLIAAEADAIEQQRRLTEPVVAALHAAGLFRLLMPVSVGGEEVDPIRFLHVVETIAEADASTAWCLSQTSICSMAASLLELDVARRIFADRQAILAWGFAPDARAVASGDGYRVTGKWAFGSGTRHASWLGGPSTLLDADGAPQRDASGKPVMRMMLFPAAAAEMTDIWQVMGLRGTASDAYAVSGLHVPAACSVRLGDAPQPHAPGALYLLPFDLMWASGFATIALGIARAMLQALIAAAREKTPRGFKRPLAETAAVQAMVAQADARLRSARLFLFASLEEIWAGLPRSRAVALDQRMTIRLAASHAIDAAEWVSGACYRAVGTTAVFANQPFERRFRDIHMVTQHAHGRHAHYETVGQFMLGLTPDLAFL